jgi:hypothetical protein
VWSKEHDALLKKFKGKGLRWEKIAESFPGRDGKSCQNRYPKYIKGALPPSKGAARDCNRDSNDSSDDEDNNSTNDDDVLPPVISSSSSLALTHYPPPLLDAVSAASSVPVVHDEMRS